MSLLEIRLYTSIFWKGADTKPVLNAGPDAINKA